MKLQLRSRPILLNKTIVAVVSSVVLLLFMVSVTVLVSAQEPNFALTKTSKGRSVYNSTAVDDVAGYTKQDARTINLAELKPAPSPADAVAYALADAATVPAGDQVFQRYVWIPNGEKNFAGAIGYTVNIAWSRATPLVKPRVVAQGKLVRVDLRQLAPRADIEGKDFKELFQLWESMALEPYFHVIRTSDDALPTNAQLIKRLESDPPDSLRFMIEDKLWYKSPAGRTYCHIDGEWQARKLDFLKKEQIAAPGVHVGLEQHVMLQGLTQSNVPIVRYDFFISKSLQTLNGGIYYELLGVERNPKGTTAQKAFYKKFGINEAEIEKARADQRVAMFKSRVTGRPRRVDAYRSFGVRPDSGTGLAATTYDIAEEDVGAEFDPIRNLLEFKDKAREVIIERANGLHAFALFNNKEELQNSAPDNVVKDHTIPAPYPSRLQPAIGCLRCHGPFDGWQPVTNDVRLMLSGYLNVFDDLADKRGVVPDILDRLAGLYAGDLSKALRRGRDDYSDAVYLATGGQTAPQAATILSGVFLDYHYTDVDAYTVCRELGYEVPREKAVYYLNVILPPLSRDIIGIAPEDPIIGALKVGLKVQRYQVESVYADMAFRALQSRKDRERLKRQ